MHYCRQIGRTMENARLVGKVILPTAVVSDLDLAVQCYLSGVSLKGFCSRE